MPSSNSTALIPHFLYVFITNAVPQRVAIPRSSAIFFSSPYLPEEEFRGELSSPDTWTIAVLPSDPDLPLQYYDADDDTCYPLPDLTSTVASKAATEAKSSLATVEETEDDVDLWSNIV